MADTVTIFNIALINLGEPPISVGNQNDPRAIALSTIYADVRDATIEAHPWNFATKRETLPADAAVPAFGFQYQYSQPTDCLRVLYLGTDPKAGGRFKSEDRKILTDCEAPICLNYLSRVEDPNKYTPNFRLALGLHLAWMAGTSVTNSTKRRNAAGTAYRGMISQSRLLDAQEGTPDDAYVSSALRARA